MFIGPSLLAFLAFSLYPMARSIVLSFQHFTLRQSDWVGLDNYATLLANPIFYVVLKNTLVYALLIVPVGVVLSLALATLIFRLPGPAQVFFKSAYYLPVVTSGVVLSLIWLYLYDPAFGLLNYLLGLIGIEPVLWLSNPAASLPSLVFMYHASHWGGSIILLTASMGGIPEMMVPGFALLIPLYTLMASLGLINTYVGIAAPGLSAPFGAFLMRQFMQTLPSELIDAGRIDGCGELGVFWRIILPLAKPGLAVLGIFVFMSQWGAFLWPLVVTSSNDMRTLVVGFATLAQRELRVNYGASMAASTYIALPMLVVFFAFQRYFLRGVTIGALKG